MAALPDNVSLLTPLTTPDENPDLNETQIPRIIAASAVLLSISTIAVILRFIARRLSKAPLWLDDWFILAALFVSWGANICLIVATTYGFGKHITVSPDLISRMNAASNWFKLLYFYETVYTVSIVLAKLSILFFYSRIFKERAFKIALYTTFGLVIAWFLAIEITVLAQCRPVTSLWNFQEPGVCIDLHKFFVGAGIPNIILNAIILLLPMPMIWTLDIERKHKFALSSVFLLGGFVVVVSIIRVVILANVKLSDITWTWVDAGLWTSVEPSIAVASACLPILRSLWIWNRQRSTMNRSTTKASQRSPVASQRGISRPPEKKRVESFTSHYPLNELSAENELPWGNATMIYSNATSRKASVGEDEIQMSDLPIQKQELPTTANRPRNKRSSSSSSIKGRIPELYGSSIP